MTLPIHFIVTLVVTFLINPTVFAQQPTDDLNGKTIHLYVESDDFNAFYFQNGDLPLTSLGQYHYTITLAGRDIIQQDFYFSSNGNASAGEHFRWKLGTLGLNATNESRFTVDAFQGKDTLWIMIDPAGPLTAPPILMLEAPKSIHILNPWPATAPMLVWGVNNTRRMTTTPGRCGWFTTFILNPNLVAGHFAEILQRETHGLGGPGSATDFDFAALFATHGKSIWLNTKTNSWSATWPNTNGDCLYLMAATIRDFSKNHPDFDFENLMGEHLIKGMVQPNIGPNRKPVSTGINLTPPLTYDQFDKWWITDSAHVDPKMRSYESCIDIPMSKSSDGRWEYDSYRDSPTDHSFFPIEGSAYNKHGDVLSSSCYVKPPPDSASWVTNGQKRNGNFCMESHATFIYQPGQTISFRGDDDTWMFINDKLVMDLGGVHTPKSDSVDLDKLGLTAGRQYNWDFFYCDRQPCASTLRLKTPIYFKQLRTLDHILLPSTSPGSMSVEIKKRMSGLGYCASHDATTTVETRPTNLTYLLVDSSGTVVDTLGDGTIHGGITIATPIITIDTAKITTAVLVPGATYRIIAFEAVNARIKVEIPFQVPSATTSLMHRKTPAVKHRSARPPNVLGRKPPSQRGLLRITPGL